MANKPPSLEELLRSVPKKTLKKPCSDKHIVEIASKITNWRLIAPHLELTEVDEETIRGNDNDVQIQRREMLRTWKRKCGPNATYGSLAKALYDTERVDLVSKVVELLTEEPAASELGPPPCEKAALATRRPAPLRFDSRCRMSVQVVKDGMQVMKKGDGISAAMGSSCVALTNRPLRTGEMFQIEILNVLGSALFDTPPGMACGITTHRPDEVSRFPLLMREFRTGTWMLDWNSYRHCRQEEQVVVVNGKNVEQDFVSGKALRSLKTPEYAPVPPLQEDTTTFALLLPYEKKVPGDIVALHVTKKRELIFSINGEEKGVVATDIPEGVYGFVELPGEGQSVELVPNNT